MPERLRHKAFLRKPRSLSKFPVGIGALGELLLWFLAAGSTPIDLGPALQQIGIGILIAAPAFAGVWLLWKRNDQISGELSKNQAEQVADQKAQVIRERELSERLGPLLAEAVKVLASAPDRFDQALSQAQTAVQRQEVEQLIQRFKTAIADKERER